MTCADVGEDLVALALGQIAGEEASRARAHVAACAVCAKELATTRGIVEAGRAVALDPPADSEARLLAAVRGQSAVPVGSQAAHPGDGVPAPRSRPRRTGRVLAMIVPVAAAAAVLVAIAVSSKDRSSAEVLEGVGTLLGRQAGDDVGDASAPGLALDRTAGSFTFAPGDEIEAGAGQLAISISLPADAASPSSASDPGRAAQAQVRLNLAPGARLRRLSAGELELVAGGVEVTAKRLREDGLVVRRGACYAAVRGTRFRASTAEGRLVVVVESGTVELGRRGGPSEKLEAGEQGLVDDERLLRRPAEGDRDRALPPTGDVFLTPRVELRVARVHSSADGNDGERLVACFAPGEGGPVTILAFDDSEPRLLLRLKGPDGRERDVKVQRSMLRAAPAARADGTWRLTQDEPCSVEILASSLGLDPGRYEASLRYLAYRPRSSGAEWLGTVETGRVTFEVVR